MNANETFATLTAPPDQAAAESPHHVNVAADVFHAPRMDQLTLWGLSIVELHDWFWASRGVQIIRPSVNVEPVEDAELFLLMPPRLLTTFRLRPLVEHLSWTPEALIWVRLRHERERGYREMPVFDRSGALVRFQRHYGGSDSRLARVALTTNSDLADVWRRSPDAVAGWKRLRQAARSHTRLSASIRGHTYDHSIDSERLQYVHDLVGQWHRPDTTVQHIKRLSNHVWAGDNAQIHAETTFVGPVWIGAGRSLDAGQTVVGPTVLWDVPEARPNQDRVRWSELEPTTVFTPIIRRRSVWHKPAKRLFDIVFAATVLLLLLPIWPIIMLAIYLEDGRPFFFGHRRETLGGRSFPCYKFRSMCRNAEDIKSELTMSNEADGPQFVIADDPRITRVGRFLRKYNLDELPQFYNVLIGHMSVVGPRPSPYEENQCCPAWREARLSVRPGITGLWQVQRTREADLDFQEWIRYDLEYVERQSFLLDLKIIWQTLFVLLNYRGT